MADILVTESTQRYTGIGLWLDWACKAMAIAAGVILTAMALMSLRSIAGRSLFESPLVGDYELVQIMCALAVSLSLPYTHWIKGHVIVDFFTAKASPKTNAVLDGMANLLLAAFSLVIAWRLVIGMGDLRASEDASMLLGIPTWWAYIAMVPSFVLLGLTALYGAASNLKEFQK